MRMFDARFENVRADAQIILEQSPLFVPDLHSKTRREKKSRDIDYVWGAWRGGGGASLF
jgi:hypothetical protein